MMLSVKPTKTQMNSSPPVVATGFTPSRYQQAIFDWVVDGSGHGFVNACAGSGKTTTLVQCAKLIQGSGTFLAFSKEIAKELKSRLIGTPMQASTIHSLGYGMVVKEIGKFEISTAKFTDKIKDYVFNCEDIHPDESKQAIDTLKRMLDLVRLNLVDATDKEAVFELAMHHSFEMPSALLPAVPLLLKWGEQLALQRKIIDFTDMIYLPVKWKLQPKPSDFVFVDEAQDLNACQLEIALKAVKPDGRLLFVGDERQAIFGFAGADADSYRKIIERTQPTQLPLNICYRCPSSHIKIAQRLVSEIEAAPNAIEGEVKHVTKEEFFDHIQIGDLVLSRKTAPLVARCISLIQKQIPAQVKGRDIGESLVSMLKQIVKTEGYGFAYTRLEKHLETYEDKHVRALTKRGADEMQIEALRDKVKTIQTCYLYWGATHIEDLYDKIRSMFGEDRHEKTALNPKVVNLCTVHRAKGLEASRVFIIDPTSLPLVWKNQQRWQFKQEQNLKYVASTRGKENLFIVGDDPEAPSFPIKGQMDVPQIWIDQLKNRQKPPPAEPDWQAYADLDTEWCAASYPVQIIIQLPNMPALKVKLERLDEVLAQLDQKVMRERWTRASEAQNQRFQKFRRRFPRGGIHVS